MAAMMYLHAAGAIAAAACGAFGVTLALRRGEAWRLPALLGAGALALLLAGPWLLVALRLLTDPHSVMSWQPPLDAAHAWFTLEQVLLAPYLHRLWPVLAAAQLGLLGLALWRRGREPAAQACLAALGVGVAALLGISLTELVLFERTLLFTLLPWLALVGAGLALLRGRWVLAAALAALLLPQARALQNHYVIGHYDQPWDRLGAELARRAGPADRLVAVGVFEGVATRHYLRAAGRDLPLSLLPLGYEGAFKPMAEDLLQPAGMWLEPDRAAICAALGGATAIWIAGRGPVWDLHRGRLEPVLRGLGAVPLERHDPGSLVLERWSPPACPAG
jgi:hypothetical protein